MLTQGITVQKCNLINVNLDCNLLVLLPDFTKNLSKLANLMNYLEWKGNPEAKK